MHRCEQKLNLSKNVHPHNNLAKSSEKIGWLYGPDDLDSILRAAIFPFAITYRQDLQPIQPHIQQILALLRCG
jgi:hypothetical protein